MGGAQGGRDPYGFGPGGGEITGGGAKSLGHRKIKIVPNVFGTVPY